MTFSPTLRALCAEATKGPWFGRAHDNWHTLFSQSRELRLVDVHSYSIPDGPSEAECDANASLIVFLANRAEAIAELAEAAAILQGAYGKDAPPEVIALRAALAKLEGEG